MQKQDKNKNGTHFYLFLNTDKIGQFWQFKKNGTITKF